MIRKRPSAGSVAPDNGKVAVTFELPATLWADQVAVVGEFNDWDPAASRLAQDRDGAWRVSLELDRNRRYEFRYLLNGAEWLNEWSADEYVPNRSGGFNSVIRT